MITRSTLFGLTFLLLASVPALASQSPEQLIQSLQQHSPEGFSGEVTVIAAGSLLIVNVKGSQNADDAALKKFAAELAGRIWHDDAVEPDRLVVLFDSRIPDRLRSVSFQRSQWQSMKDSPEALMSLKLDEGSSGFCHFQAAPNKSVAAAADSQNGGQLGSKAASSEPPAASSAIGSSSAIGGSSVIGGSSAIAGSSAIDPVAGRIPTQIPNEISEHRNQLLERLETLRRKGVGTQPYMAILGESDAALNKGNNGLAKDGLDRLDQSLKDQEKQLASRSTVRLKSGVSQSVAFQAGSSHAGANPADLRGSVAAQTSAKPANQEADLIASLLGGRSIADIKGTESQAAETLARSLLGKTLGQDCPEDGPFLVERIRLGARIHELEKKHMDVSSYRSFNRDKIESLVKSKDPRTLKQLAENIKYLDRLVGLEQFEKSKR